jgi:pimeloyl-ACP methyl ester carboxylesterase
VQANAEFILFSVSALVYKSLMNPKGSFLQIKKRKIHFRVYGEGKHKFFFHHGFPGSSLQAGFIAPYADKLDVSVCSFDRPGYGSSDYFSDFAYEHVAGTVQAIADSLGWKKFHQFGVSGGSPFALAGSTLPNNLSCSLVGPLGPIHLPSFRSHYSFSTRALMRITNQMPSSWLNIPVKLWKKSFNDAPEQSLRSSTILSQKDKEVLLSAGNQDKLSSSMEEAFRQGAHGPHHDVKLFQKPWDFGINSIRCPIHLWHGSEDKIVPAIFSEMLCDMLPNANLTMVPGEGHYSLPIAGIEPIVRRALS